MIELLPRSCGRAGRTTVALLIILCVGCPQPERLAGTPAIDPRRSAAPTELGLNPLATRVLSTHADYDAFEEAVSGTYTPSRLFQLYRNLIIRQAGLKRPGDRRLVVRWLLLALENPLRDVDMGTISSYASMLARGGTDDPDVLYLAGALGWRRLVGGLGGAEVPGPGASAAAIDAVVTPWEGLVTQHPAWVGPHGVTADLLRSRATMLRGRSAASSPAPSAPCNWSAPKPAPPVAPEEVEVLGVALAAALSYVDQDPIKACERLLPAGSTAPFPPRLGTIWAHCLIDRNDLSAALRHLQDMVDADIPGGIGTALARLRRAAASNGGPTADIDAFAAKLATIRTRCPATAVRFGL